MSFLSYIPFHILSFPFSFLSSFTLATSLLLFCLTSLSSPSCHPPSCLHFIRFPFLLQFPLKRNSNLYVSICYWVILNDVTAKMSSLAPCFSSLLFPHSTLPILILLLLLLLLLPSSFLPTVLLFLIPSVCLFLV